MDDIQLKQSVLDELFSAPNVDASLIRVLVHHGVVTLVGSVPDQEQKRRAELLVLGVAGVVGLAQGLDSATDSDDDRPDDSIVFKARSLLDCDDRLPVGAFTITSERGDLTIRGEADSEAKRRVAESDLANLDGVHAIHNEIHVAGAPDPGQIQRVIRNRFEHAADLEADRVTVQVAGEGTVVLGGHVHTVLERASAEDAAWAVPGVVKVVNQIEIGF